MSFDVDDKWKEKNGKSFVEGAGDLIHRVRVRVRVRFCRVRVRVKVRIMMRHPNGWCNKWVTWRTSLLLLFFIIIYLENLASRQTTLPLDKYER